MLKKIIILLLLSVNAIAQNNINNPYSLFGLGVDNNSATGGLTGMGNSGIAKRSIDEINIYNPANLGNIQQQSFLQDFGFSFINSTIKNYNTSQSVSKGNIAHITFAFPIKKGWGVSFGLLPYTTTGYKIDVENDIGGTNSSTYTTTYVGTGGLNKFYVSTGLNIGKRLSLGVDLTTIFGSIDENSGFTSGEYSAYAEERKHYSGAKLSSGIQYTILNNSKNKTVLGGVVSLPTSLSGDLTSTRYDVTSEGSIFYIQNEEESELDDFELPLSYGLGLSSTFKNLTTNFDYKKVLWGETNQANNSSNYINQNIYALGLEYLKNSKKSNFFRQVKYRLGFNYNSGFIEISDENIKSYFISAGVGIPLNKEGRNRLNFSYSYGQEGTTASRLIQENFHKVKINFTFNANWFKKRKIY